jgi:4-amino-4-deoxy-L-arabinose transferase-like glycosyltransferase
MYIVCRHGETSKGSAASGVFLGILLLFVVLAGARIATKRPWVDEAWFTSPALDLATHGRFGTHVLEPTGSHLSLLRPGAVLTGIDRHTYWIMPLYPLTLAAWGKLFGFSAFSMRVPSVFWGILLLFNVRTIVRRLGGFEGAAVLATAILAVEFAFVDVGSDARMDMMSAALGFSGLASYLTLRDRSPLVASLVGHTLCAAALFTHPNGLLASISLLFCAWWMEPTRQLVKIAAIGAMPYAVGGIAWGAYIMRAPGDFAAQFGANSTHRMNALLNPLYAIYDEVFVRYLQRHFLPPSGGALVWMKTIGLLVFGGALAALILTPKLRAHSGYRLLWLLAVLRFLTMAIGASWRFEYYLVHALPFYAVIAGIVGHWLWNHPKPGRRLLATATLGAYFAIQLAIFAHLVISVSAYRRKYLPAMAYLSSIIKAGDLVTGPAELAFTMGFYNPQLVDDIWLGHWSGQRPTIVVVDDWYYGPMIVDKATAANYVRWVSDELSQNFKVIKTFDGYTIYRRVN